MHANAADRSLSAKRGLFPSLHTVYRTPFSPMRLGRASPKDEVPLNLPGNFGGYPHGPIFRAPVAPSAKTPYSCKQFSRAVSDGQLTLCY